MRHLPVRSFFLLMVLVFAVLTAYGAYAQATTLCVDNAKDLFDDLKAYSDGGAHSGDDLYIDLVIGNYKVGADTGNKPFTYLSTAASGFIEIEGGFTPNCAEQVAGAHDVILDGNNTSQVLKMDSAHREIILFQITIQNGNASEYGGLAINTVENSVGGVAVEDCVIQNNHSSGLVDGLGVFGGGDYVTQVSNNLIINNDAETEYGGGFIDAESATDMVLYNNTVYGNTTANGDVGGLAAGGVLANSTGITLSSNIFSQNTHDGLYLIGTAPNLYYNDYGNLGGVAPSAKVGNLSVSPKFVDPTKSDFHLGQGSPLIGISHAGFCNEGYDLDGHGRAFTGPCDPGAYEETIYRAGFDP